MLLVKVHARISQSNELGRALQNGQGSNWMAHGFGNPICNARHPQHKVCDGIHVEQDHSPDFPVNFGFVRCNGGLADGGLYGGNGLFLHVAVFGSRKMRRGKRSYMIWGRREWFLKVDLD